MLVSCYWPRMDECNSNYIFSKPLALFSSQASIPTSSLDTPQRSWRLYQSLEPAWSGGCWTSSLYSALDLCESRSTAGTHYFSDIYSGKIYPGHLRTQCCRFVPLRCISLVLLIFAHRSWPTALARRELCSFGYLAIVVRAKWHLTHIIRHLYA